MSFLDAAHGLDEAQHQSVWDTTEDDVTALMSSPPDIAKLYRDVAFVLAKELAPSG